MLAMGLICAVIYGNSLRAPFVFDDAPNITLNPHIRLRELSLPSLAALFKYYKFNRPLANFSFAINYFLNRYDVFGYHVVNVLIHLVNGLLVFRLACLTLGFQKKDTPARFAASFLAAALWLTNPVHTQSVTYVVQRMNSLAALFYLASMILYIQARKILQKASDRKATAAMYLFFSVVSGICSMGCKEIAVTLPLMIFLYEWFFISDLPRGFVKEKAPYLLVIGLGGLLVSFIYFGVNPLEAILLKYDTQSFTLKERLLTQPRVIVDYLSLLLLPLPERLTIDHYVPVSTSLTNPTTTLAAMGILLAMIVLAVKKARSNRLLSFAILWFLGTLAVESSFIGLELMYEHRTYLPSVFLFIALTCLILERIRPTRLATGTLALMIGISGFWTYQRNAVWADEIRFWNDATRKSTNSIRPFNNLGIALAMEGRYEEGIAACRQSIALSPPTFNSANAYNNIGCMYLSRGESLKAVDFSKRAIEIDPDLAEAHMNLGKALLAEKNPDEAIPQLEKTIDLAPHLTAAYTLLAHAYYLKDHDTEQAVDICRRAMAVDPEDPNVESFLGGLLMLAGDFKQAENHLLKVLKRYPDHPQTNLNAGVLYNKMNQPKPAVYHLSKAVAAMPDNPLAQAELGSAFMALKRWDEAEKHIARSAELSPNDPLVLTRLALIFQEKQDFNAAARYYEKVLAIAPESPQCINRLAAVLAEDKKFDEAVDALKKLEKLLPQAPTVSYNLACIYARQNKMQKALVYLEKAKAQGYSDWEALQSDADLESFRETHYYRQLIKSLEK